MPKLYRLDIDSIFSNISLFTDYDVGGEGHSVVVEEQHLNEAIAQIVENFSELIASSFEEEEGEE